MAANEITIEDEHIETISQGNVLEVLLKQVLEEILDAEMTEHLGPTNRRGPTNGLVRETFTT